MAETLESSLHTLPEALIFEILLHVQDVKRVENIKSIGRCKCVSKTWRSLLSSPQFAKSRLDGPEKILFLSDDSGIPDVPESSPYVATLGDHGAAKKVELPFLEGKKFRSPDQVQGSCHGLVLLFFHQGLLLANPTTLEALEIPLYGGGIRDHGFGLGYDSCTDDYKVVSVQEDNVDIYSAKTRTWRTLKNPSSFSYDISCSSRPFVNGRINFVSQGAALAAFNVGTEKVESVPYPKGVNNFRPLDDRLNVLGGCLALVVCLDFEDIDSYDVWLMKEYGVQESWTKFSINPDIRPICFLSEDESELVSLETEGPTFIAHNWTSGVSRDMAVDGMPHNGICVGTGISFRESLISPNYGESVLSSVA